MLRVVLVASVLCSLLAGPARADVIVVDPQGFIGGHLLVQAIGDANDGDIILIRPGDYVTLHVSPYELGDKSLSLVADAAGAPIVLPGVAVTNLGSGRSILLRGLTLQRPVGAGGFLAALRVSAAEGVVTAEDCTITGADGPTDNPLLPPDVGVSALDAGRVALVRCTVRGGNSAPGGPGLATFALPGSAGVWVQDSLVALFDCEVIGGRGGDGNAIHLLSPDGGHGVRLVQGHVVVSGGELRGGDEGSSTLAAKPGSGLMGGLGPPYEEARVRGATITAGAVTGAGTPVADIALPTGSVVDFPAAARSLSLPAPLRELEPAALTFGGLQADLVLVLGSAQPAWVLDDIHQGVQVVDATSVLAVLVATITSPDGQLSVPFTTPRLPASVVGGTRLQLQAVHFGIDGVTLGAPTAAVWIDAAL